MVSDEVAHKVQQRVLEGMGLIVLHSGHMSKPFCLLMGTSGSLRWREGDFERLWNVMPRHPIAQGIGDFIEIEEEEMYGECFDVPAPDDLVFIGWFAGGEVMRSGCCWNRGNGKVFYFQPGHEFNPTFHMPQIQRIIINAVRWAKSNGESIAPSCSNSRPSPEEIRRAK
jgi:trehalose utilization protein